MKRRAISARTCLAQRRSHRRRRSPAIQLCPVRTELRRARTRNGRSVRHVSEQRCDAQLWPDRAHAHGHGEIVASRVVPRARRATLRCASRSAEASRAAGTAERLADCHAREGRTESLPSRLSARRCGRPYRTSRPDTHLKHAVTFNSVRAGQSCVASGAAQPAAPLPYASCLVTSGAWWAASASPWGATSRLRPSSTGLWPSPVRHPRLEHAGHLVENRKTFRPRLPNRQSRRVRGRGSRRRRRRKPEPGRTPRIAASTFALARVEAWRRSP
jgi:hypothetical protein